MRYFIIIIIKSSTQQQPKYPCAYNFTLIKQKRNLKLSKWGKKNVFICNERDPNRILHDLYIPEGIPQQICLKWMLYL